MAVQLIRKARDRQPRRLPVVRAEFRKHLDFLWIPGLPELVTNQNAIITSGGSVRGGRTGKVLKSTIASYTGTGAYFLNQKATTANVTMLVSFDKFAGVDNSLTACLLGNTSERGLMVDYNGQLRFLSSVWHDTGLVVDASPHTVCAVFGESYGSEFFLDANGYSYQSGSGLYNWSAENYRMVSSGDGGKSLAAELSIAVAWNVRFPASLARALAKNPWQIFEPETIPLFFSTVTAQYARPTSDVSTGTWTASSGSDLFAMLDETTASDADYIVTTGASTCEVALAGLNDPAVSTGHIVRYRISSTTGGITVRLRQGTTTIASWTHNPAPTSLTTYSQTLSAGEADSITNYGALKLQFEAI